MRQVKTLVKASAMFWVLTLSTVLNASPADPMPVAVLCGGDDGLTSRLCAAIEHSFSKSSNFVVTDKGKERMLKVRIPTNVDWKKTGGRAKVFCAVEYLSIDDTMLGRGSGSCWDLATVRNESSAKQGI
jgi:hypothetical protein